MAYLYPLVVVFRVFGLLIHQRRQHTNHGKWHHTAQKIKGRHVTTAYVIQAIITGE
jgi:hypothetical protein